MLAPIGKLVIFGGNLCEDNWLDYSLFGSSKYLASIIAEGVWIIWKARYDLIFKSLPPSLGRLLLLILGEKNLSVEQTISGGYCIYSDAIWALD